MYIVHLHIYSSLYNFFNLWRSPYFFVTYFHHIHKIWKQNTYVAKKNMLYIYLPITMKLAFFLLSQHFIMNSYMYMSLPYIFYMFINSLVQSKIREFSAQKSAKFPHSWCRRGSPFFPLHVLARRGVWWEPGHCRPETGRHSLPWSANIQPDRFAAVPGGRWPLVADLAASHSQTPDQQNCIDERGEICQTGVCIPFPLHAQIDVLASLWPCPSLFPGKVTYK